MPSKPEEEALDLLFRRTKDNAERLIEDSRLLAEHGRAKSSIILAVFALEEFGKALITLWEVKNQASKRDYPTHVEKQAATFALLSANEMVSGDRKRLQKHIKKGTLNFLKIGPYSHQFAWARSGFYDDLRMAATYADKDPKIPGDMLEAVALDLPSELHEYFSVATKVLKNKEAMNLAAMLYANGLGRL